MHLFDAFRTSVESHPNCDFNIQDHLNLLAAQPAGTPLNPLRFKAERTKAEAQLVDALDTVLSDLAPRVCWRDGAKARPRPWAEQQIAQGHIKATTVPTPSEPTAEETDDDLRLLREMVNDSAKNTKLFGRIASLTQQLVKEIGQPLSPEMARRTLELLGLALCLYGTEQQVSEARGDLKSVYEARIADRDQLHEAQMQLLTHETPRSNGAAGPQQYRQQARQ